MTAGKQNAPDDSSQPGKLRTWWHPLLVRVLDFELHDAYEVRGEVPVGQMPLRVDIVLIRRQAGQLPESAERDLSAIVPRLSRYTLLEFKAPLDALEPATWITCSAVRICSAPSKRSPSSTPN